MSLIFSNCRISVDTIYYKYLIQKYYKYKIELCLVVILIVYKILLVEIDVCLYKTI